MHDILQNVLVPGVPVLEKVLRSVMVYVFLAVVLRLAGKRELGALTPLDLIVAFTLSNAVQNAIIGNDNSVTGGMIGGGVLLLANYLTVRFLYAHRRLDRLIEGEPDVLIEDGQILHDNLRRERITEDQLLAICHQQGVERIEDVKKAILETSGTISIFAKHPTPDEANIADLARQLNEIQTLLRNLQPGIAGGTPATAS